MKKLTTLIVLAAICLIATGCASPRDTCSSFRMVGYGHDNWKFFVPKPVKQ